MPEFVWSSAIPASADDVYAWHARPAAFERLAPPWADVRVVERSGGIEDGGTLVFEYHSGPLHGRWTAQHLDHTAGRRFVDRQVSGPFKLWEHTHSFIPQGDDASLLEDHVEYQLPYGAAADVLGTGPAAAALERLFRFRHQRTRDDLLRYVENRGRPRLRIAITGATGMIGSALADFLSAQGHTVVRVVRGAPGHETDVVWDPGAGKLAAASLEGIDAVIHLAGETTQGRWTIARKSRIMRSRGEGTLLLAKTLAGMKRPPRVLLSASAIGYYGDRGDEPLSEESAPGHDFLAEVVKRWESALEPARAAGIRVVPMRFGIVLSAKGGALKRMLPAFRAGAGGPIGGGRQWMSWVALDDLLAAAADLLYADDVAGPVVVTAPDPVTNREFVKTLGHVLHRPAVAPLPALAVKAMFGKMGETLLLQGQKVQPRRLEEMGFRFGYAELEAALRWELGRSAAA